MLVHVVNAGNRRQYMDEIEQMHRLRHRVFVEQLGWTALESPDGIDVDEFDNANATHLIAIDAANVVRGSARLTPTWRVNMLGSLFPEYVAGHPPCGPGVWEWTRHAPGDSAFPHEINQRVRLLLHIALHEFAISRSIDSYTGIADTRMVPRMVDLGWKIDPIGLPTEYGEGTAFAFMAAVVPDSVRDLRERLGRHGPVLIELPGGLTSEQNRWARQALRLASRLPENSLDHAVGVLEELTMSGG